MEAFWKWLMRANAHWVFWCALAALLLVIAWWTWKECSPLEPEAAIPASALRDSPAPVLGLDALLEAFQSHSPTEVPANVFLAPDLPRQPGKAPVTTTPSLTVQRPANPNVVAPPEAAPQPAPPPRNTVSLTYRGLFQRPDGRVLGLIEDSKTKRGSFYAISNELFGMKIDGVSTNEVSVTLSDGSVVPLKLGQPAVFEGGKRAN